VQTATQVYNEVAAQTRRDELILTHLSLVRHVIGKLVAQLPPGADIENLESAGTLGLVEAATHFEAQRGIQFKTYAFLRIRGAVLDELRRNCPLPQHMLQRVAVVRKAYEELQPPVTVEALAAVTGMTSDDVADCLAAIRLTRMVSINHAHEALGTNLHNRKQQPASELEQLEEKRLLGQALTSLEERERQVVTLYFLEDLRLKEIGQVLNLSESRVSRILSAALLNLSEFMRSRDDS
jgi:RNA polymerase sigma factor for flagellar operon FliA